MRRVVVPTESVVETKDGQKVQTERRLWPGYVLVNMDLTDDAWCLVKNTPGRDRLRRRRRTSRCRCRQPEVDRMLHTAVGQRRAEAQGRRPSSRWARASR